MQLWWRSITPAAAPRFKGKQLENPAEGGGGCVSAGGPGPVKTGSVVSGNERWRFPEDLPSLRRNGVTAAPRASNGLLSPRK